MKSAETFPIYWGKKYVLSFSAKLIKGYTGPVPTLLPKVSILNQKNNHQYYDIESYLVQSIKIPYDDEWRDYEIEFVSKCHVYQYAMTENAPVSSLDNYINIFLYAANVTGGVEFIIDRIKLVALDHTMEFDYLETNNIKTYIEPIVPFLNMPKFHINYFEVPKNSRKSTIYGSMLWLGGLDNESNLHLAAHRFCYRGKDFWMGPATTDYKVVDDKKIYSDAYIQKYYHTWKVSRAEINYHRAHYADADYVMPWGIANWPAHGRTQFGESPNLAPYKNVAGSSSYEPALGDYPDIQGDQAVLFIINDAMDYHTETYYSNPLYFDILGMAYAFNSPDSALQNTLFLSYELLNNSTNDYHNFYFGLETDLELGYGYDDYVGCDTLLNIGYIYNGTEIDGDGGDGTYGANPPVQGMLFLNQKMNAFVDISYKSQSQNYCNPQFTADYYNLLQAQWKDETHITYGGNGYNPGSTDYTNFMFSGDPVTKTGWTEFTPNGPESVPNPPDDRHVLMSSGPFTFPAGERLHFDIALPFARDYETTNYLTSLTLLKQRVKKIQEFYEENILGIKEHNNIATGKLLVYPNPTTGVLNLIQERIEMSDVRYEILDVRYETLDMRYEIFDIYGRNHQVSNLKSQISNQINITHLPAGIYFLKIGNETVKVVKQ